MGTLGRDLVPAWHGEASGWFLCHMHKNVARADGCVQEVLHVQWEVLGVEPSRGCEVGSWEGFLE